MKKNLILFWLSILLVKVSIAQNILDGYVHKGLSRNQPIQQQQFQLEKNVYAL